MTFDQFVEFTLDEENGFSDRADDPGGVTNWGQTIPWLTDLLGHPVDRAYVVALTRAQAKANYILFAERTKIRDLSTTKPHLAAVVFDFGVNSGVVNAIRAAQRAGGATPDGVLGPVSLHLLSQGDDTDMATEVMATRLETYARLSRTKPQFIEGWLGRAARLLRATW